MWYVPKGLKIPEHSALCQTSPMEEVDTAPLKRLLLQESERWAPALHSFLSGLDKSTLGYMVSHFEERFYEPGEILYDLRPGDELFIVLEGSATIHTPFDTKAAEAVSGIEGMDSEDVGLDASGIQARGTSAKDSEVIELIRGPNRNPKPNPNPNWR